jgi:hypothetical protein
MVVAPTLIPSLRSSPWTRTQPQSGVLTPQTEDEVPDLGTDAGTTRTSPPPVRPLAAYELPVPPQKRLRCDHERGDPGSNRASARSSNDTRNTTGAS